MCGGSSGSTKQYTSTLYRLVSCCVVSCHLVSGSTCKSLRIGRPQLQTSIPAGPVHHLPSPPLIIPSLPQYKKFPLTALPYPYSYSTPPPAASYQSLGSPYPIQPPTITRCQAPNHSPPTTTLHRNHPVLAHSDAHCATAGTHSHSHSLTLSPQLGFQFRAWKSLGCGRVAPGYGSTFATLARLRRSSWIFTSRLPT